MRLGIKATLLVGVAFLLGACNMVGETDRVLGTTATDAVQLYIDCPFSGRSVSLGKGSYTVNDLTALGMPNDNVSAIRVQNGFKAEVFVDTDYRGRSLSLTKDDGCLVDDNFNDLLSSVKVTRVGTPCNAPTWTPGVSYRLGDVVLYPANDRLYKVVNVTAGGTDATDPTISTWYWQPTTCEVPPGPNPPTGSSGKVVGTYYATFAGSVPRLKDIDPNYNLVYLFAATQAGGEPAGTLRFAAPPDGNGAWTNWAADLQVARSVQKRKMILSVGGANAGIRFTDRNVSTNFVNSVVRLYNDWGGFDGLDFNTFEADFNPNTPEMIWIAKELKRRYPGFLITAPPAPWNPRDQRFCKEMLDAGALDYCAPQYYDGPDLNRPAYLLENITLWMDLLGPSKVVVGFGVNNELNNYWTVGSAVDTFRELEARYPEVRGVFDWRLDWDARDGYPFARQLGPLVRN